MTREGQRLREDRTCEAHWKGWGPYLSERQRGTVREDHSADGMTWRSLPHDHGLPAAAEAVS